MFLSTNSTISVLLKIFILGMRKPYNAKKDIFLENNLSKREPLHLFNEWFQIVKNDPRTVEANAMCLATANQ